jgi:hypothetical protein
MVKIQQVAALRTELLFDLVGYPRRSIAYGMDVGAGAKARLGGARKELSSRRINVALQGASIRQCLAALGMSQTDFGFLPVRWSLWLASGSTSGTIPPSISTISTWASPACVGQSGCIRVRSNIFCACPSVMRRMVLSPSTMP